ncbi:non-ribosomal peptide synthetase, partial [Archangium lipolyticum]|uniref:non-ribosomal peptide synthetase n=1 Tax=Archangium lipolyticum TaxID=2970465 RepID=UPI00214B5D5F
MSNKTSDLEKRIANLPPEKRELLLRRLAEQQAAQAANTAVPAQPQTSAPVEVEPGVLSFAQHRLWFLEKLQPGTSLYNNPFAFRLLGIVDAEALRRGLEALVTRHAAMRTTFVEHQGEPRQVVRPPARFELPLEDLRALPEPKLAAQERMRAHARQLFDLERGPLVRATLLRLSEHEHLLLLTLHHIICDGWSMELLMGEMAAFYQAFSRGMEPRLPPLSWQYPDFARWQRQWMRGAELERQLGFWRERLRGAAPLELPLDRPRPVDPTLAGAVYPVRLERGLTQAVQELAQREGATPFMVLLAAFQVLLGRYAGQDDVVVGTPIANRTRKETEGLIGLFVNTLALRTTFSDDPSFRELVARVRQGSLEAYAHQDVPFEAVVDALQPERDLRRTPLFQVMFVLHNVGRDTASELPELRLENLPAHAGHSPFDLTLSLSHNGGELVGELEYGTELFDESTVARFVGHLRRLLEEAVAHPERRLSALGLLTEAERERLMGEWKGTRAPFPGQSCLHHLVEAQAVRTPEAVAAEYGGQRLTYTEMMRRARGLARRLRALGVGPEVRVGLCARRSLELVVGMLGVLEAGGAWVPMDPSLPTERLGWLLEDSGARVLLTQEKLLERLPARRPETLCLDSLWSELEREADGKVESGAGADNLAYVLYTSGSTGRPKGTLVTHRGVVNLVVQEAQAYQVGPGSRVLQFASPAFDISVEEIFTTLCAGGTVCLAPAEEMMPGPSLQQLLRESSITVLSLTPAALAATPADGLPALRTVISGGEACPEDVVARWAPERRFLNTYGPTEATVVATLVECQADGRVPPIGRALPNVEVYVLDGHLRPVPVGHKGELYLGGVGLARGYLGRADLTAERFIPHPFSTEPGARLYRTGDVVRWRGDGQLEFSGRADQQVKVRGFRIEPGEIEAALVEQPAVREAVVVAREDVPGNKRLVAYLVARPGQTLEPGELRKALRQRLPEYMVPSAFMVLEALPLTTNGKVDRRALPAPQATPGTERYVPPRNAMEELVAGLFGELLRAERVGAEDNFFELGGHSLLATQVVSRLRESCGVEVPLRTLFEAPTVAELAGRIQSLRTGATALAVPALKPAPRDEALPLSFAQQRLWFLDRMSPGNPFYNMPLAVRLEGELRVDALAHCVLELQRRHEVLRTTFRDGPSGPVQCISAEPQAKLEVVDLSSLPSAGHEAEVRRRAGQEAEGPFDLERGPLLRAVLLRLDARSHVLLVTMHHIVTDGWSAGILVREVAAIYEALVKDQTPALPELPVQYADFAVWQRQWLRGEALEAQLGYWRRQLAALPVLELPTDRPRPPVQSFRGAHLRVRLPRPLSEALVRLSRREGVTLYMTLLTAFQAVVSRYSGQTDVVVGTDIANRNRAETEGLLGFFVNQLVMRGDLSGNPSFRELLAKARETALAAYAHQDVPFEELVRELNPERSLGHAPLFQVKLLLQNAPDVDLELPGVKLGAVESEARTAKFDLTVALEESPEGLRGHWEYSTDLFDEETVARMSRHYQRVLEAMVANPGQRLGELSLLSEQERHQVLVEWNATTTPFPSDSCAHHLVQAVAARSPDAPALCVGDSTLSFRELEERSNQLAHHLLSLGVGVETPVALCLERSFELVIGLLAILKAGGTYVPLEPSLPAARLGFLLQDCGAPVLLTQESLADELPAYGQLLCLDSDWHQVASQPTTPPSSPVGPDNLAYIIYTSGSTGQPKGTLLHHRGLCNTSLAAARHHGFTPTSRVLQFAALSFDASIAEIFGSLVAGSCLVLAPR